MISNNQKECGIYINFSNKEEESFQSGNGGEEGVRLYNQTSGKTLEESREEGLPMAEQR